MKSYERYFHFAFLLTLLLSFTSLSAKESRDALPSFLPVVGNSFIMVCDTITYLENGKSLQMVGTIESTQGDRLKIRDCASNRTKFLFKRLIISINRTPFTYDPISQEEMKNIKEDSAYVMIIQDNGNRYLGKVLESNSDEILIETREAGKLTLNKRTIKSIRIISDTQFDSGVWLTSHGINTRYFFGTNGYSLEKGTGYYQNTWVLFNQFSYGVSDNLSLGGGLIPLFLFNGTPTPFWGTIKYSLPLPSDNFHLATGALFGVVPVDGAAAFGLVFAQATLGSNVSNVNFGMGYGFGGDTFAERPAFSFSTLLKAGKKTAFVSENYLIHIDEEYVGILSLGLRFYLRSVSIDGALIFPASGDIGFAAIPWLGLSVPFGE